MRTSLILGEAEPAAGVEDTHSGPDAATEKLIEEIDVYVVELFLKGRHRQT